MKLVDLFRQIPVAIEVPTTLAVCNPSILATECGWSVLVRALDPIPYSGTNEDYLSSENWLIQYDKDLRPQSRVRLQDEDILENCAEARNGLEDGRLFEWSGQQWGLFSGLQRSQQGYVNSMILAQIDGDCLAHPIVLPSPHHYSREKNWMPWVLGNELYLIYSTKPLEVYRYEARGLVRVHGGTYKFKNSGPMMSGSSQVIPWGNGYLAIIHQRNRAPLVSRFMQKYVMRDPEYQRKKVQFSHCMLLLDRNFNIKVQSSAFHFENDGIEFCAGIACQDDRVLISYGVMDEKARLIELDPSQVDQILGQKIRRPNMARIAPVIEPRVHLPSVGLIVLNYRNFKTTAVRCLDSLWTQRDASRIHVKLLDNGSPDDSMRDIEEYAKQHPELEYECLSENLGFAGGMNYAARQTRGEWLILVNNDTIFLPGSLDNLSRAIASAGPDIAAIGPVTNAAGNAQDYFLEGTYEQIQAAATLFHKIPIGRLLPVYRLDFFCVAIRRTVWDELGGLDPVYGLGYYEDFDFSVKARQAGYRLMMCEDAFVYHRGGTSFKQSDTTKRLIRTNRDLFTGRYPEIALPHKRDGNMETLRLYQNLIESGYPAEFLLERIKLRMKALSQEAPKSIYKRFQWKKALVKLQF
ncbi:MAG: glycosyltransferase family 2 protein [Betaproteobacteria bacterium]|nr:glycosyltransferase family 2 protein [Betaproteobacteria bacterium]